MNDNDLLTIQRAAASIRQTAQAAKSSDTGRWVLRATPGLPQSIVDDTSTVLVADTYTAPTAVPARARHILAWDWQAALSVAELLDVTAAMMRRDECPVEFGHHALEVATTWLRFRPEDDRRTHLDISDL